MCEHCKTKVKARYFGIGNDREDQSYYALEPLLGLGYTEVRWVNTETACPKCQGINGYTWSLQDFLYDTDGAIYRKSHPNCMCYVEVMHPNGTVVRVNYNGEL